MKMRSSAKVGGRLVLAAGLAAIVCVWDAAPAAAVRPATRAATAPAAEALAAPAKKGKPKPKPKVAPPAGDPGSASAAPSSAGPAAGDPPSGTDSGIIETRGGTAHVDFSEATIEGVGTKAGAVYLYERSESDLLSIVRLRTSYRDELIRTVFSPTDVEVKKKKGAKGAATPAPPVPATDGKTPAKPTVPVKKIGK